jgi:hypothetical protein
MARKPQKRIQKTQLAPPPGISFSFKYFQADHPLFYYKNKNVSYFCVLLERLRDLSGFTALDIQASRSSSLRCHPIKWRDTTVNSFDIPNEEQLVDVPYQFVLSANKHGRVHGFFIGSVFYVVWLDPDHKLYS